MATHTIRAASVADTDQIKQLALDNAMFEPDELDAFDEMLGGFHDGSLVDHQWIVVEGAPGTLAGAAYYAPEPFSDRMWNLYFIATAPNTHGSGVGTALITHVEGQLTERGPGAARTLIVDTSSLDGYAEARAFYTRRGFVEESRIRDFYGPGDHKVTFWKSLVD